MMGKIGQQITKKEVQENWDSINVKASRWGQSEGSAVRKFQRKCDKKANI